ncbi:uncharacterized protein LOC111370315 [Olea europaea var. sylvestris]|uniref:uncharacterized protein LOC111370315 n=1 Tax=Olea europaea var. sylvestris TaxID=158386 RepID=UPI000C1CCF8B|nr:uncharacterized protein LOC111370315 [Olea europaea var. sylvestris]
MGKEENMDLSGCSGGGGGGRSKKEKQKKVPRRGLGVAQLEKIRLEQKKNDATLIAANLLAKSIVSLSSNSIPLAPPSPNDLPSPNSTYNLSQSIPYIEFLHPNSVQFSKPLIVSGGEIGLEHGSWPRLWNGEYNLEGRNLHRFTIQAHTIFPYESNPFGVLPLPSAQQRVHQFQPPTSSSMGNAYSGISSSSVLDFQIEPPSNQSYLGNNYRLFWPEEEKMVGGIKRSYPFSMETPPAPSFHGKFHPKYLISISGSDETGSCSNGCTTQMEPSIKKCSRENPSTPGPLPEQNPNEVTRENRGLNGDFLTLAPPVASFPLISRHKHPYAYSGHQEQELSDLEYIHSQGSAKDPERRSIQQLPFTFFPSKVQIGQGSSCFDYANGEKRETVDLDLKL